MRFIYFYFFLGDLNFGSYKKVISQCNHLIKNELDVNLSIVIDQENINLNQEFMEIKKIVALRPFTGSNILLRIRRQFEIRKILINLLESASSADIVYLRYPYPLFYMLFPFSIHGRKCKIVNEHNTIEPKEYKLVGSHLSLFVDILVGNLIRRNADGIVGVTDEITSYEVSRSGDLMKPHITIGNGIEVNRIKLRKSPSLSDLELNLLCVASFSRWHGIDRLLSGLALYEGDIKVRLFLVGDGPELPNLRLIVEELKLADNVIFTGILGGDFLDNIFDISHIAIGSLGLHRMDMKEASILKAREYCARGIPFLNGCTDPDFPDHFPYIEKVPGDESAINIEEIIRFAGKVYSDPDHHIKMRIYAEKNLDWSIKMKKLKGFCETLVEE